MVAMGVVDVAVWLVMMGPLEWGRVIVLIHNIVSIVMEAVLLVGMVISMVI